MSNKKLRVLVTSGPTREYIDPVRFLTNGSSGQMGLSITLALLEKGFEPVVVSGPVSIEYPSEAEVHFVETTEEMLMKSLSVFGSCVGAIGTAAPCDYKPREFSLQKISKPKTGVGLSIELEQTEDILATLGKIKRKDQWSVGFALETENGEINAMNKLKRKNCNFIALNSPNSINNDSIELQVFNEKNGRLATLSGTKLQAAKKLIELIVNVHS
ncbi:MAG: phosphopantothenoylcysteine decarboxylase [Planctomycetaceae bacterium]|jgi:phosphopantothenoylcysteine decarboxylase/phosphopantothenate--cysteine ligase|nr:phosphopantothenoylcysteine decarboxylase [Planctomycetaceae bacterium]